jgi:hypothetical protein
LIIPIIPNIRDTGKKDARYGEYHDGRYQEGRAGTDRRHYNCGYTCEE